MQRTTRFIIHASIWTLLYFMPGVIADGRLSFTELFDGRGIIHLISTILLIAYWYLNWHILVPEFFQKRKYVAYCMLVIISAAMVIWFPNIFQTGPSGDQPRHERGPGGSQHGPTLPFLFGMGYNVLLFIICTFSAIGLRLRLELMEVEKQKTEAELAFLKSQINPHFLFNTLNSIYALAIQKSDDTPMAIIQLSDLMRYLLKEVHEDQVDLSKELHYISNYIALQKRRLGDTVMISYQAPETSPRIKIAPLLLMPFIENAFKHGVNPDQHSQIEIKVEFDHSTLKLKVVNAKVTSINQEGSHGIGLQNTIARLQYLYPEKYSLQIDDAEANFSADLSISFT